MILIHLVCPTQEGWIDVVNSGVHNLDLRRSESRAPHPSDIRLSLDPQQSIKAMPLVEMSGVTTCFKPMSTPVKGSMGLFSVGSPISRGYGIGYVFQMVGFIGAVGPAQVNGGVVLDFWDPFLVMSMMSNVMEAGLRKGVWTRLKSH